MQFKFLFFPNIKEAALKIFSFTTIMYKKKNNYNRHLQMVHFYAFTLHLNNSFFKKIKLHINN